MCESQDVIKSTNASASTITKTLRHYGDGSLGGGVRKLAAEKYIDGYVDGAFMATLVTTSIVSMTGLSIWAYKKIKGRIKKTDKLDDVNYIDEVIDKKELHIEDKSNLIEDQSE